MNVTISSGKVSVNTLQITAHPGFINELNRRKIRLAKTIKQQIQRPYMRQMANKTPKNNVSRVSA